jgi:plasmid maintenance system antidote protein VapI
LDLRPTLTGEFEQRRARNPRYSWRAFARDLRTHHTTLRQIIQRRRRLTPRAINALGGELGLSPTAIVDASLHESVEAIGRLVNAPHFRPDSRWIAMRLGLSLDDVNRALQHALCRRLLIMDAHDRWRFVEVIDG